jgi:hypothetical protein
MGPETRLAPCQVLPLIVHPDGRLFIHDGTGGWMPCQADGKIKLDEKSLRIGKDKARVTSPRAVAGLLGDIARGTPVAEAVREQWRRSLSAGRAAGEWKKWRVASGGLRWCVPLLAPGFFGVLPLYYLYLGTRPVMALAGILWLCMAAAAANLWWLGSRPYREARPALRMDSLLCLLVPFHAMRALEEAANHAMAGTHPAALLVGTGDLDNPWLKRHMRNLLYPRPGVDGDIALAEMALAPLEEELIKRGRTRADYDQPPARGRGEDGAKYCPRCHSFYSAETMICADCRGIGLKNVQEAAD